MAKIYADEQFPRPAVEHLRRLGHDILTVQEAGCAGSTDPEVLMFAIAHNRTILTQNRRDFIKLHQLQPVHAGIVVCSDDPNFIRLAARIHQAILSEEPLQSKLIRVVRPAKSE